MKKQFFVNSFIYFIAIVAACLVNFIGVSSLVVKIVNLFIVVDFYISAIISAAVAFVVVGGVVGTLAYFEAFKSEEFAPAKLLGTVSVAGVFHLAISTLMGFHPFIAGGTKYLAGLISMGEKFDSAGSAADIYLWEYLASFAIYLVFEIIAVELGAYLGKRRRAQQKESLTASTDDLRT